MTTSAEKLYEQIYKKSSEGVAFCPYRICPIGAHSDHQLGKVTGMAINAGVRVAYGVKHNGVIELSSAQFERRAQWHVNSVPEARQNDWADYLRGATLALNDRFPLRYGISGVIEGSLPIGGLSSSAAVIIAFLSALCRVNRIMLTEQEMILTALEAENKYVGVACGKLDQSCEVYSKRGHLLYLDTLNDSYELIPTSSEMRPYKIAIFFSGIERTLAGSKFNMRVDELRSGMYALQAFAGMEYGKFNEAMARYVPREVYEQYKDRLPATWARRCEHWYTEFERVEKGAEAWRRGDIEAYGKLSFESGWSSIHNWESGAPEQIRLYEIMTETDGIYGGRFSGAGFKGGCMALIDPAYEELIRREVTQKYLAAYPEMTGKYEMFICESADGVIL